MEFFRAYEEGLLLHDCVPGMPELIENLAKDYVLLIISSTIYGPIHNFLTKHQLRQHFVDILGLEVSKDKTKKIKQVFDAYSVEPSDCLFITDTLGDIKESGKMRVKCIAVTWGFHSKETLDEGSPLAVVETPAQLANVIRSNS